MPLFITREDIAKIKADAIVNPTNYSVSVDGGIDKKIHRAADHSLIGE